MINKIREGLSILTTVTLLATCHSHSSGNKKTFRYNEPTGIATLDPAFAKNQSIIWPVHQIYNTLVQTDSMLNIIPSLAISWQISPDHLTYRFHLRQDVYFQDNEAFPGGKGRKMVAEDIVYSLSRLVDHKTASSGAWIFNERIAGPQAFQAPDDSTFELTLISAFHPMLGLLSMQYCSVVPHEVVDKYGKDFRNHPCGTGPFQFSSWEEGQDLILLRNPHYFEKDAGGHSLPYLDAIKISFFDNRATEFLMLQQGRLDFMNDIDPSFKDEVLNKKGQLREAWKGRIQLSKSPYLNTEYLGIVMDSSMPMVKNSPLRLLKVRQAINYGFDRRKMMMYLRNSIGTPAESGFIPPGLPCFDSAIVKGYHYDPAKARQLLKEAGFPDGAGLPRIILKTIDTYADLAGFIVRELEEVGISVQVDIVQKSLLLEETAKSQAPFFRASWIGDYPDAENYLSVFYSENPAPPNYTRYHNPEFDALYRQSLQENNDSLRYRLYRKMDQLMIRDAPIVPLWYDEVIHLVSPAVRGFEANGLNLLELRHTQIR
ncbi:MAG: ABC transporter substrate-binding protein [Bacteroidota bacterium]|nr:ABC transporter substrate-binding protein [Bacteroidota bacterium]